MRNIFWNCFLMDLMIFTVVHYLQLPIKYDSLPHILRPAHRQNCKQLLNRNGCPLSSCSHFLFHQSVSLQSMLIVITSITSRTHRPIRSYVSCTPQESHILLVDIENASLSSQRALSASPRNPYEDTVAKSSKEDSLDV